MDVCGNMYLGFYPAELRLQGELFYQNNVGKQIHQIESTFNYIFKVKI